MDLTINATEIWTKPHVKSLLWELENWFPLLDWTWDHKGSLQLLSFFELP